MAARTIGGRRFEDAQLFCLVVGATLTAAGLIGFTYISTFTSDESVRDAVFGILDVNGWHNLVHLVTGLVTLAFAFQPHAAARTWALIFGVVYLAVAVWGFVIGSDESILSIIPVNTADSILHLLLGVAGVATYALTARPADQQRVSVAT
jgi:Domain of unknown function (DUF4383)